MVTQKLIPLKLDADQLRELDITCAKLGINRNKFINFLVSFGNSMLKDVADIRLVHAYNIALEGFKD